MGRWVEGGLGALTLPPPRPRTTKGGRRHRGRERRDGGPIGKEEGRSGVGKRSQVGSPEKERKEEEEVLCPPL